MSVPVHTDRDLAVRVSADRRPSVRDGAAPERVVSVLFGTGIEEWRCGWQRTTGELPTREVVVSVSDLTRGAAAVAQVVPGRRLAYTALGPSTGIDRILDAVSRYFDEREDSDLRVLVDDIEPLLTERGRGDAAALVEGLRGLTGDVVIGCSFTDDTGASLASLFDPATEVGIVEHPILGAVDGLRQEDPTTFGYVRRHWVEARGGIERCERNYPQSKQIHEAIVDPETTPRTLGAALSGLVTLGVLDTWGETVGSTRYDLTAYSPTCMWLVGAALATGVDGSGSGDSAVE
ncbi:DUF7504 family protein [Halorubrum amylolyticum]|uniref:DUF7504 family protein n=1 Tax=Halorubrum amylolyticum TaxID=2508724 RepID=UPI001F507646|nr:hypothetical protein [Halorubrum amylolyticum]